MYSPYIWGPFLWKKTPSRFNEQQHGLGEVLPGQFLTLRSETVVEFDDKIQRWLLIQNHELLGDFQLKLPVFVVRSIYLTKTKQTADVHIVHQERESRICGMFKYSRIIAFNTTIEWVATYTFYRI